MTKVFISYSRKDKVFAGRLTQALQKSELETWIDWEDIPPTADWMDQIHKGIESTDGFIFLLSPDSVASKVCAQEIDHAVENGKRLIPIVVRDVNPADVHPALAKVNWIYCRDGDNFDEAISKTLFSIRTDLTWVEAHRRLQVRAIEWDKRKDRSLLLRGKDLREAESQLASAGAKDPLPTDLQRQYVLSSRNGETRTRNIVLVIATTVMIALAIASVIAVNQSNYATHQYGTAEAAKSTAIEEANSRATAQAEAETQAKISRAGELAALSVNQRNEDFQLSLLLAAEAYQTADTNRSRDTLFYGLQTNPQLRQYLDNKHNSSVLSIAFSPDGKMFASGSWDGTTILWDATTWEPLGQPFYGYNNYEINSPVFSPDGKTIALGSCDITPSRDNICIGKVILLDVATQLPIEQFPTGINGSVTHIAFSPDGRTLAAVTLATISLWDLNTGQSIDQFAGNGSAVYDIVFSQDGKTIISGNTDKTITLWDVSSGQSVVKPLQLLEGYDVYIQTAAFSPDGTRLAVAVYGKIILWDAATGRIIGEPLVGVLNKGVSSIAFSSDGAMLAVGQGDAIVIWDMNTLQPVEQYEQPLSGHTAYYVTSFAFSPDGKTLISGYFGGTIILWNMDFSLPLGQSHSGPPVGFNIRPAFSPDVRIIASSEASTIYLSNVTTGQEINRFFTDYGDIDAIAFSPDGTTLAVANQDKSIALLDVKTGQIIGQPLLGHKGIVTSISFSPDGNKLASVSYDDAIILWDVDSHLPIDSPLSEKAWIAAFSPNGKFLATSGGTTIILWDLSKHPPLGQSLTGHENSVNSLTFSPDGKTLASGSQDATIRFWDVTTGTQIDQLFPEQNEPIYSIAFSPDGKILASVNTDYTISLWDISTSQPFGIPLAGHTWDVYGIAFSTDGKTLVSGSIDGTIILWDFDPESWLQKTCQRAGRNLTRTEWELYGFTETYHPTCQQWPLEPAEITTPIITPTSITNATSTP